MDLSASRARAVKTVAILGGGFSGAAVAVHLATSGDLPGSVRIVVIEPRAELGRGLAYSASDPAHRINVPAGKMTLFPDRPEDFEQFLSEHVDPSDQDLIGRDGLAYPGRSVFGDYVSARLRPFLENGSIEHWQTTAETVSAEAIGWRIAGLDGASLVADLLVLAVSHPPPAMPAALSAIAPDRKLVADVTTNGALSPVSADDHVLIVGNGLTAADVVASLNRLGHRGHITSISRRGLRSRGHGPAGQDAFGDKLAQPGITASGLLRRVRHLLREAQSEGRTWHSVLDAVRAQGQEIWAGLQLADRRRIARHLRPFWDVHRFRIAPQVEDVIDRAVAAGRMDILAASIETVTRNGPAFRIRLRRRHGSAPDEVEVNAIVVTTGPAHGGILQSQTVLRGLHDAGVLTPCPTGLGISVDRNSHPVSTMGEVAPHILIAGPLARGTFGELMGLPQVTEHAVFVARRIVQILSSEASSKPISAGISSPDLSAS